jgi:hypothetical protein
MSTPAPPYSVIYLHQLHLTEFPVPAASLNKLVVGSLVFDALSYSRDPTIDSFISEVKYDNFSWRKYSRISEF